ncbi:pickpocket protein 28-like [Photinus pyralis]|uniref:pickpocket protein 28-like n=1 Tax=Photinus pyralis TaxID=7054 RepID=UPI0012670BA8|nr:pickpocket protein 28-like [Photinus pyralis]
MKQYTMLYKNTFGKITKSARKRTPLIKRGGSHRTTVIRVSQPENENGLVSVHHRPKTLVENVKFYLVQYSEATTIHGIKYIGERGRSALERLIWTIIVVVVCVLCVYSIRKSYLKWQNSPVVMTFATIERSIASIPFPAVTICPEAKFDPDTFNFTEMVRRKRSGVALTAKEREHLHLSYLVCRNVVRYDDFFYTTTLNRTSIDDVSDRLFEMMPNFDVGNVSKIIWNENLLNFTDAFDLSVTTQGVCYTFNMMAYEDMLRNGNMFKRFKKSQHRLRKFSFDGGYQPGKDEGEYPRRTFTPGLGGGLTIDSLYTNSSHLDDLCEGSLQGFKVVIHAMCELPNMDKHIKLPLNHMVNVAVKPSVVVVSKELQQYSPKERKCYFFLEKFLATYKVYTQKNCMQECLANFTRARCGCIPFYFARKLPKYAKQVLMAVRIIAFSEPTKVCGPTSFKCVQYSKLKYLEMEHEEERRCACLPSCFDLLYHVETSHLDWNWKRVFDAVEKLGDAHYNTKALKTYFTI